MSKERTVPCLQWGQLRETRRVAYVTSCHMLWGVTFSTYCDLKYCPVQSL